MNNKFPSREEFLEVFSIFPKGNPEDAYREVKYNILTGKTFTGQPLTWSLIKTSYTSYVTKRLEEQTQEKFIKGLQSFIKAGDYNIDFSREPSQQKKNSFEIGLDESMTELENRLNRGNEKGKGKL